jgi:hypothetical protein
VQRVGTKRHLAAGQRQLLVTDLANFRIGGSRFDTVLAMNVNLFWTGPAEQE